MTRPTQDCTQAHCAEPSVPGLVQGCGKCPYHWAEGVWGREWANECHPEHPEAKAWARARETNGATNGEAS